MKRYFHVAYSHNSGFGCCQSITNGTYPSLDMLVKEIKTALKRESEIIVILNIFELSEQDYNDFNS